MLFYTLLEDVEGYVPSEEEYESANIHYYHWHPDNNLYSNDPNTTDDNGRAYVPHKEIHRLFISCK